MKLYEKVIEYVDKSFKGHKPHFEKTVYWLEQIMPNITDTERIAAYSHNIERAFREKGHTAPKNYLDPIFLKNHQEDGAKIIGEFLQQNNVNIEIINKVKHLVSKHEVGGDAEQNALMDPDSISYFETNAQHFVEQKAPIEGYQKIKEKFDWMFNRISSEERKGLARNNYEKWIKELEKYK